MFAYLPYDRVSGQWGGVVVKAKSDGVEMTNSDSHSPHNALWCDSTVVTLTNTIIHNCKGYGLYAHDSKVALTKCLVSNALNDCLSMEGCQTTVDQTTLAQFYPFSANRGAALRFNYTKQPMSLVCKNTLVTGYAEDVIFGKGNDPELMSYHFENCLLRTGAVEDSKDIVNVIWEKPSDEIQGQKHFVKFDDVNFIYDFRLKEESPAFERSIGWPGNQ
jgi:hypothetical protein